MEITSKKSLLGMSQETSEGLSAKKNYSSPSIKVVEFVVEAGFQASPVGSKFYVSENNQLMQTDPETPGYHWTVAPTEGEQRWF